MPGRNSAARRDAAWAVAISVAAAVFCVEFEKGRCRNHIAGWLLIGWPLIGCVRAGGTAPAQPEPPTVQAALAGRSTEVFVARRGWHVDVGFAVEDLAEPLHSLTAGFPGVRYLLIGFGDRRYLVAKHRGAPVMLSALWPGPGMLLVTALRAPPAAAFGTANVVAVPLPREAELRLQAFVWQALSDSAQAALLAAAYRGGQSAGVPGPYTGSVFLESRDTYSALHTCNTWVAEALGEAGAPIHSNRVMFAGQLWNQVRSLRAKEGEDSAKRPVKPTIEQASVGPTGLSSRRSMAGRFGAVLTYHRSSGIARHDDGGLLWWRRTAAADAAGEQARKH